MPLKRWVGPQIAGDAAALAAACGCGELTARILCARGITAAEKAKSFLQPGEELHDPFMMADMDKAVFAIEQAMDAGRLIVIYGDYDCDGITSTVLLYRYLEERGAQVAYYIPDREEEGYGLNREACHTLYENGAGLVITVDNGVTAFEEIAYLKQLGIPAVVTDHHQPQEMLPDALAVINPHREGCPYPFKELSGVGVTFKLVCALEGDSEGGDTLARWADLVCIGTIADVVSLTGENRAIAAAGLRMLSESENPGILALLAAAGLSGKPLQAQSVSFGLAPRLNAASRMGCCEKSVNLMLCDDPAEAARLAAEIDGANTRRKALENEILAAIRMQLAENPALLQDRVLLLWGEGWHRGVIGIAAARLVERYGKPVLLFGTEGGKAQGSARSIPGFSIIEALRSAGELMEKLGGHPMAAGMTLREELLPELRRRLNAFAQERYPDMPVPCLRLDAVLSPQELDIRQIGELERLEPFGADNEPPILLLPSVRLTGIEAIGGGKHLRIRFLFGGRSYAAVWFNRTPVHFPYAAGELLDLAANIALEEYAGQQRLSIKVRDARPHAFEQEAYFSDLSCCLRLQRGEKLSPGEAWRMIPQREQLAQLYRAIRSGGPLPDEAEEVFLHFYGSGFGFAQTQAALSALSEAGLVGSREGLLQVLPAQGKADLEKTRAIGILRRLAKEERCLAQPSGKE
ncbi:MAG: single-stranded-DNA-specific exonuclease RecJ [Provencibacterium sp.]|nr:single-stranded-DNA-specific exonuclease RecJ [Provencibacterium sp.]